MENKKSKIAGVRIPPGGVYVMNPRICAALEAYPLLAPKFLDIYSKLVKKIEDAFVEYNRDIDELLAHNKPIKPHK